MSENTLSKSRRYSKILVLLLFVGGLFGAKQFYVWLNTQSTDNAYIEADISSVSAEVGGVISKVYVRENNYVKAGQVIAKIQDDDYKAQLSKADSALDSARHNIEKIEQNTKITMIDQEKALDSHEFALENFKIAETDYKRTTELSRDNFASKKNLDRAKIALEKAKNELSQSELNMQMIQEKLSLYEIERLAAIAQESTAKQELILSERNLKNTKIIAPIDGILGNSSLREGNYIRPGVVLFSVVPIDKLYVKANFKETQISKFRPGMKVQISIDSESGSKIIGTIRNISPATGAKFSLLPPANATGNFTKIVQRVPVIIDFEAPEEIRHKIVPGMSTFVQVRVDQEV